PPLVLGSWGGAPGRAGLAGPRHPRVGRVRPPGARGGAAPGGGARAGGSLRVHPVGLGPEAPLVAGVADALREASFPVFGPSSEAAVLEGSKAFAKEVMETANVPTARAQVSYSPDEAAAALREFGAPHVVKADGLAAG